MDKLQEIYTGVHSGDIGESKFKREIKNLMLALVGNDDPTDEAAATPGAAVAKGYNTHCFLIREAIEKL